MIPMYSSLTHHVFRRWPHIWSFYNTKFSDSDARLESMAVISDQHYAMPFPDGEVWVGSGWQDSSEGRNERCQQQRAVNGVGRSGWNDWGYVQSSARLDLFCCVHEWVQKRLPRLLEIGKYMLECRIVSWGAETTAEVVMGAGWHDICRSFAQLGWGRDAEVDRYRASEILIRLSFFFMGSLSYFFVISNFKF